MMRLAHFFQTPLFAMFYMVSCAPNVIDANGANGSAAAILLANLQKSQETQEQPQASLLRVFETSTIYGVPAQFNSVAAADAICQSDPNYPGSGVYRAMIAQPGVRVASVSPNAGDGQVDWVIQANRRYIRLSDQQTIQISNAVGLFVFPLLNPVHPTNFLAAWTGLNTTWQTGGNCSDWSSNAGSANAGDIRLVTSGMLFSFNNGCGGGGLLVCVEQ
ncbi:MAG: DUF1554 domain-containing protein [Spirochaetia bacterium]|nr:DUF1554 domain-containing protein [Spirochaetia bacterium]